VALHLDPSGREPVRETRKVRVGEIGEERQVVRDGIQQIAHGALVCPGCNLPVVIEDSVGAGSRLQCGFCDHSARAREFVAPDVYDTVANEVYVVARVA
jgi:hypothetical protein